MKSVNPATNQILAQFESYSAIEIERRLQQASDAQKQWTMQPIVKRAEVLRHVARTLRQKIDHYARLITLEMGKPLTESVAEIQKCAWNFEFYAEQSPVFMQDLVVQSSATDSRIVYDPLGLVLAVMPWNYPFWQVMRAAAPILAGGNGMVLKHAANVPQCALALEDIFLQAGVPDGLFTTLLVGSSGVAALIEDQRIHAVTFTGSTPVGRTIAAQAGRALKKQVLELGGSDPFIVLADANVEQAATAAVKARFHNTGQSCISAKRFIVEESIAQNFVDIFCELTAKLVTGNPLQMDTNVGSMARPSLRDDLHAQVQASVQQGAKLLVGGKFVEGEGVFYQPTVLDHVTYNMTAAREETFGPAAAIMRVKDAGEAIKVANGTEFGLGAALWTTDMERARSLSRVIEAGAVFINGSVASDPRLPFGGTKQSGYGRELGALGMHEFSNVKTVWTGPVHSS